MLIARALEFLNSCLRLPHAAFASLLLILTDFAPPTFVSLILAVALGGGISGMLLFVSLILAVALGGGISGMLFSGSPFSLGGQTFLATVVAPSSLHL